MPSQTNKMDKEYKYTIIAEGTYVDALNYTNRQWWDSVEEAEERAQQFYGEKTVRGSLIVVQAIAKVSPLNRTFTTHFGAKTKRKTARKKVVRAKKK